MSLTTLHGSNFLSDARGQTRRSRSWRPQVASAMPVEAHRIRSCRGPGGSLHRHAQFDATPTPIHSLNKPVLGLLPNRNYYFNHLFVLEKSYSTESTTSPKLPPQYSILVCLNKRNRRIRISDFELLDSPRLTPYPVWRFELRIRDDTFGDHQLRQSIGHCQIAHHQFFECNSFTFRFFGHWCSSHWVFRILPYLRRPFLPVSLTFVR